MTELILHVFAAKRYIRDGKRIIEPDFEREIPRESKERKYTFSIELDRKNPVTNKSFRQENNTMAKLNNHMDAKAHTLTYDKLGARHEHWTYCPKCIIKIAKEMGLQ